MCRKRFLRSYSTCFGLGNFTSFPGTLGSVLSFGFLPLILVVNSPVVLFACFFIVFAFGVWSCFEYENYFGKKDPKEVIIDEFAAQGLLLILIKLYISTEIGIFFSCLLSFVMFRFFDIIKPWPIKIIERMKCGFGIMLDDLAAALFSFIILAYVASIHLI